MSYIPLIARVESLPPLPESVVKIESLYAQGELNIDDIVKIIETDPTLTTDILARVNAPLYGFSKTIIDVLQAVTLFGSNQIRAIVLASSINRGFNIDLSPYGISTHKFSIISTLQSELMFQWYMGIDIDIARDLTPIAFLMETGKVLIAKYIIESHKTELFLADLEKYRDLFYVENIHAMMTTAQINALIFQHLNLPESFSETMKYLDAEHEIPQNMHEMVTALHIVRTAVNIQDQLNEYSMTEAIKLLKKESLDTTPFQRVVKRLSQKYLE